MHAGLKNINIDGNPIKMIRRTIIEKGSTSILCYLKDKFNASVDSELEQACEDEDESDVNYYGEHCASVKIKIREEYKRGIPVSLEIHKRSEMIHAENKRIEEPGGQGQEHS